MPTIERSRGLPTGHLGLMAGGGYSGATEKLDAMVMQAAEMLRQKYRRNVDIRFNSDRKSGGAWLRTHAKDILFGNAEIGICVTLFIAQGNRRYYGEVRRPLGENYIIHAHIGNKSLRDVEKMPKNGLDYLDDPTRTYAHREMPSLNAAMEYLNAWAILRRSYKTKPVAAATTKQLTPLELAAKQKVKNPEWYPWIFEAVEGGVLCTGAVCPLKIRGPDKGAPNYRKADRSTMSRVFVSAKELRKFDRQ